MEQLQQPLPVPDNVDKSGSISDESKKDEVVRNEVSDPVFEDKVELKYEDCPEKTGFAYPS